MDAIRDLLFLRLSLETSVPPRLAVALLQEFGPDWSRAGVGALLEAGIPAPAASRLADPTGWDQAELLLKQCQERGFGYMTLEDPRYPKALARCDDPPVVLYWRGQEPVVPAKTIAIVGTRKCTPYGRRMTRSIVQDLAGLNPLIVSGMALGIDIAAHMAALDAGLLTWGIFAHGLDRIYPPSHKPEALRILDAGGTLLAEFPPGVPSRPYHFPRRNRIVAGLADAVLVVETKLEGGSLITAGLTLSYHREVFALPGPVDRAESAGCNFLIRENSAALISSGRDLAESMDWVPRRNRKEQAELFGPSVLLAALENQLPKSLEDLRPVLIWLAREGPQHQEAIAAKTLWSPQFLASRLLEAELRGWLFVRAGGYAEAVLPSEMRSH
ncbi:MAG: DNA-protecting protein DprA [Bacteroidetes bacterium]|nr:DNA-protecting protein DprA [Bacteroidota bacterium]